MKKPLVITVALVVVLAAVIGLALFVVTKRVEGAYFSSRGVTLHYTDEGRGSPVVLLHGFAVNSDLNWRLPGITADLAQDHRVISLDLRGHGLSDKPHRSERYGLEMAVDVVALLDHLQIDRVQLVGYSLGGFIALKLASLHPERLISATLMAAGWEPPNNPGFLDALAKLAHDLRRGGAVGPLSAYLGSDRERPSRLHDGFVRLMTGYFNDPQALAALLESLPALALAEPELSRITRPLCMIVGSRDPLKKSAESLKTVLPDTDYRVIEGADHIRTTMRAETHAALRACLLEPAGQP